MRIPLIAISLLAFCRFSWAENIGTLFVQDYQALPGQICEVQILADANLKSMSAVQFRLHFGSRVPESAPPLQPLPADPKNPQNPEAKITLGPIVPAGVLYAARAGQNEVEVGIVVLAPEGRNTFDGPGVLASIPLKVPPEAPPGTVYRLDIELIVLNDGNGKPITVSLQGGALGVVSPHRLYIDGGSPKLPDRETWLSISYESDTDTKLSAAVIGISVVPDNPAFPLPQLIGAVAGQAASGSSVTLVLVSPSTAIVRIEGKGQLIGEGTIAYVRIRTPSEVVRRASYRLSLNQVRLYDPYGAELIPTLLPGSLRVALPTGDVNADGRVDIIDVGLCLRYALGLLVPSQTLLQRADIEPKRAENIYGDGVVNISDVLRMLRIALGFDERY